MTEDRSGPKALLEDGQVIFFCPGCRTAHPVPVEGPFAWDWNGSVEAPTLTPSIKVTKPNPADERVCHSYVTDGAIQFLEDCTHSMAGRTVDLPEWKGFDENSY